MGEGERESDSGEAESCASPHHQLTVDSRAIKDTAVKAAHQINDNNSQKFLSRSLKKKEPTAPLCDVISSAYASQKPSQKSKLAIGRANVGHASGG